MTTDFLKCFFSLPSFFPDFLDFIYLFYFCSLFLTVYQSLSLSHLSRAFISCCVLSLSLSLSLSLLPLSSLSSFVFWFISLSFSLSLSLCFPSHQCFPSQRFLLLLCFAFSLSHTHTVFFSLLFLSLRFLSPHFSHIIYTLTNKHTESQPLFCIIFSFSYLFFLFTLAFHYDLYFPPYPTNLLNQTWQDAIFILV